MRRARKLVAPIVVLSVLLGLGVAPHARAQTPPNVLFIINDDHGWPFHSFLDEIAGSFTNAQGPIFPQHPYLRTPPLPAMSFTAPSFTVPAAGLTLNLDRLARRGAVFSRGHAADSVCVASYKSTQTGLNLKDFDVLKRFSDENLYPKSTGFVGGYLSQLGYDSFAFGKSWEDFDRVGFTCTEANAPVPCKADWEEGRRRITPVFDFIVEKQTSPPPRQWFVWYATELPHEPMNGRAYVDAACADPNACAGYCGRPGNFTASKAVELPLAHFTRDHVCRKIAEVQARMEALTCFRDADCPFAAEGDCGTWWDDGLCSEDLEHLRQGRHEGFFANVLLQDFWVGLLLDFLEKPPDSAVRAACTMANPCCYDGGGTYTDEWSCLEGVNDDTLIAYQADNGFAPGRTYAPGVRSTGWKRTTRENGFRTPMLLSLPRSFDRYDAGGNLLPFAQTQIRDEHVHAIDLLPTILHLASGVPVPQCGLGEEPRLPKWVASGGSGSWEPVDPADTSACLEGRSLAYAVAAGPTPAPTPRPHLFMQRKGQRAAVLTHDGFRLVRKGCSVHELTRVFDPAGHHDPDHIDYNDDPDERTLIAPNALPPDMSPTRLDDLKARMQCWFENGATTSCKADPCNGL